MPQIEAHASARISPLADLEPSIRGSRIVIGADSHIDSFVKIKPAGGPGDLIIGANVTINSGCVLYTGNGIIIGDNVAVAANCVFAPVNHEFGRTDKLIVDQGFRPSKGGILIENDVWIGASCVFLDGAIVRSGSVIGAGSLVSREVPRFAVGAGNPFVVLRTRE